MPTPRVVCGLSRSLGILGADLVGAGWVEERDCSLLPYSHHDRGGAYSESFLTVL